MGPAAEKIAAGLRDAISLAEYLAEQDRRRIALGIPEFGTETPAERKERIEWEIWGS